MAGLLHDPWITVFLITGIVAAAGYNVFSSPTGYVVNVVFSLGNGFWIGLIWVKNPTNPLLVLIVGLVAGFLYGLTCLVSLKLGELIRKVVLRSSRDTKALASDDTMTP